MSQMKESKLNIEWHTINLYFLFIFQFNLSYKTFKNKWIVMN